MCRPTTYSTYFNLNIYKLSYRLYFSLCGSACLETALFKTSHQVAVFLTLRCALNSRTKSEKSLTENRTTRPCIILQITKKTNTYALLAPRAPYECAIFLEIKSAPVCTVRCVFRTEILATHCTTPHRTAPHRSTAVRLTKLKTRIAPYCTVP